MRAWRVRRQYGDVVRERIGRADVAGVLDLGLRWVGSALSRPAGRPLVGPTLGTLLVTYRCNLRCRVCDLPRRALDRRRRGETELDTRAYEAVLRDMKAIGVAGVGASGGEPMLRGDLLDLLAYGTRLGLHMHLNSDGFRVSETARALVRTGIRSANISLDGATAEVHDRARRRAGAFEDAVGALTGLARARRSPRSLKLTAVCVLTSENLEDVEDIARTAFEAGADRLGFVPVHDFGQGEKRPDAGRVAKAAAALRDLYRRDRLDNSPAYVDLLGKALAGDDSPLVCYAPHTSVVVDCYGDVYPCFPLMERKEPVGSIPLARLWRSREYAAARRRLASCRACLWNCHAEMNLALPQPRTRGARA